MDEEMRTKLRFDITVTINIRKRKKVLKTTSGVPKRTNCNCLLIKHKQLCVNKLKLRQEHFPRSESDPFCFVFRQINNNNFRVAAGLTVLSDPGPYVQIRSIGNIRIHEDFDPHTFDNDVAVVVLSAPLNFTEHVQPACRPFNVSHEVSLNFSHCFISGWGSNSYKGGSDTFTPAHSSPQQAVMYIIARLSAVGSYTVN